MIENDLDNLLQKMSHIGQNAGGKRQHDFRENSASAIRFIVYVRVSRI